jgi:Fe-S-cluster-containing dehydrogenase component
LCGGNPQCVEFCVPNALEFKDPELTNVRKSRAYAKKIYHQKEAD